MTKPKPQYLYFIGFIGIITSIMFFGGALGGILIGNILKDIPIWLWAVFILALVWMVK